MTVGVVIASYGNSKWKSLAEQRALPSVESQGFDRVVSMHLDDGTLAMARNYGQQFCDTDWVVFLDADDELDKEYLSEMRKKIETVDFENVVLVPSVSYVRRGKRQRPMMWPETDFKTANWVVIGAAVQTKTFLRTGGFMEYGMYEDYALWAKAHSQGAVFVKVPEAVYVAHQNPNSRNIGSGRSERLYWHQKIGYDIWPDDFDAPTAQERTSKRLSTEKLRTRG